jgi:hypothetical protein
VLGFFRPILPSPATMRGRTTACWARAPNSVDVPLCAGGREVGCQADHSVPALQRRVSAIERPSSYLGMPNVSLSLA